jgi:hypothetical protein
MWKLAKVVELLPGSDGKVRAAIVKVANSDTRPLYLRRVVQHLIPIEVKSNNDQETQQHPVANPSSPVVADSELRPDVMLQLLGRLLEEKGTHKL